MLITTIASPVGFGTSSHHPLKSRLRCSKSRIPFGHRFLLVLFAPLNSTASVSFRDRHIDVIQLRFQQAVGDNQRADGRTRIAVARRDHFGRPPRRADQAPVAWDWRTCFNLGPSCLSTMGQTEKNSLRANVFRVTPESGHCSMQSACLKGAINGILWLYLWRVRRVSGKRVCCLRAEPSIVKSPASK